MARYVGKRIVPKHCGVWDRTRSYEMDCIVYEQATGDSYISRKEVPAGTALTQEDYWALCARFSEQMALLRSDVKADVKEMHDSLEETEAAVNRKTDSAVDTMTQRTQAAEKLTNTNKSELNGRMDNMEKRLDANVTASTTPSGDYAAEVVDARVGWDDTQYDSLGSAIRGQLGQGLKYAGYLNRVSGSEDMNDLELNTVYLISSNAGETGLVNFPDYKASGVFITAGTGTFTYQIFFGGEGDRIFMRYRTGTTWKDWKDLYRGIDAEFENLYRNLELCGAEDYLHRAFTVRGGEYSSNGVKFTFNTDGSVTVDGTATGAEAGTIPSFYNMYAQLKEFPKGMHPGGTYIFRLDGTDGNVLMEMFLSRGGEDKTWERFRTVSGPTLEATIPEGCTGFLARISVLAGKTAEAVTVYPSITPKETPEEMFTKSAKFAGVLYRNSGTDDLNELEVNTVYTVSSSEGATTLVNFPDYVGHGVLMTLGSEAFHYQIFFGGEGNRIFLRCYTTAGWRDWKDYYKTIDQEFEDIYRNLNLLGAEDLLHRFFKVRSGERTFNGIKFTFDEDGFITVDGTVPSGEGHTIPSFYNMYANYKQFPEGMEPGETYICRLDGDVQNAYLDVYLCWKENEQEWTHLLTTQKAMEFTIPEGTYGFLTRIMIPAGKTVENARVYPSITRKFTPEEYYRKTEELIADSVKYTGILQRLSGTEDLNTLPVNSIYLVSSNTGETSLLNFPDYNGPGILISAGVEGGYTYQIFIGTSANSMFLRFRYGSGIWADWRKITDLSGAVDSFRGTNPNSHMLSYGNSILSGSVWKNQKYDHLAAYYNAPYGVIANAIGIPKENVKHTVVSSTGLLYDAGQGSFLENIKKNDLAGYDVVLTHLWTADMSRYQIGTESATAGDGTIAGGVVELINYMKDSNGGCQLILVGVPPTSTSIYGEAVFTGKQPDGSSIAECDGLMHKLAKKYHFVFLDWEGLNLAYYYHNFSDGMNVHANNEDTYRIMGAYLGGRASMEIRF